MDEEDSGSFVDSSTPITTQLAIWHVRVKYDHTHEGAWIFDECVGVLASLKPDRM